MFECIPNISEGRDEAVISDAAEAIKSAKGVKLLHTDAGYDANRTVFTFIGDAVGIEKAIINLYQVCLDSIDLRKHVGAHPRLGAVDVCPIVPLKESGFEEAIQLAAEIGNKVCAKFNIPVFFYELSQKLEYRKKLSSIRRGQFEGLGDKIKIREWQPDCGPSQPHPSFGATVIGARDFLIAFNVSLESRDVQLAREIAKILRDYRVPVGGESSSKWLGLRAIGWEMPKYNCVQVSTNLVDMTAITLAEVYLEIQRLAGKKGVRVLGSELIGLVPKKALTDAADKFTTLSGEDPISVAIDALKLSYHSKFDPNERILENYYL